MQDFDCQSNRLLTDVLKFKSAGGQNVELDTKLAFFQKAFNQEKAMKDGKIIPKKGTLRSGR